MFRILFVFVLTLGLSSQAIAAVKWNNSTAGNDDTGYIASPILPKKGHMSNWCTRETYELVKDPIEKEEKLYITDEELKKASTIEAHGYWFDTYVNFSLYNRTASLLSNTHDDSMVNDFKNLLKQIGKSKFATRVKKRKSTQRLLQTDFLLLYTYSVVALDETGNLTEDEKKTFIGYIKTRMNLNGISSSHAFKGSECTKKFMGEDKFDVFSCQNHTYGKQHLRMLVGVLTNNKNEIEKGRKLYKFAIDDLGSTGALWREASRGAYSWVYYPHALGALMAIGDIDKRLGGELFSYKNKRGQSIHDAVKFYIDSLKDPTNPSLMMRYAKKNVGIDKPRKDWNKPKSLGRHERVLTRQKYSEWFPIYANNFSEHPNVNAFKDVIQFNPNDEAPEKTYHLGLNSWCVYDSGYHKSKEIPTLASDDCELKRTIVKANGEFETQCLD